MNYSAALGRRWNAANLEAREELAHDLVDVLWSHGFTYDQCWTISQQWFKGREDLQKFARDHLDVLDFTHHGRTDMET